MTVPRTHATGFALCAAVSACSPGNVAPAGADTLQIQERHRMLAAYWAPAIENDSSPDDYRNDYITRFDFDGDWSAGNNWDNRVEHAMPSVLYYWIVESRTHAFLGYGLYKVANGEPEGSENDMQGGVVVTRKVANDAMGRFEAMLVWSHGAYRVLAERSGAPEEPALARMWHARLAPLRPIEDAADVNFIADAFGVHPVLYTDADAHRLEASPPQRPGGPDLFHAALTDWRHKDYSRRATAGSGWGEFRELPQDGILYVHSGDAQLVVSAGATGRGRYKHHWEIVGYELRDLAELWQRRDDRAIFVEDGVFAGDGKRSAVNRAPWAWTGQAPLLHALDPVRQPGALAAALARLPEPFEVDPIARSIEP